MELREVKQIMVIGGGIMGQGIAQSFAQAGMRVIVVDIDKEKLDACMHQIMSNLRLFKEYNLLKESIDAVVSRIRPTLMSDLLREAKEPDFIIEAVPENLDLKRDLFTRLDKLCEENVVLATNTSSFTIDSLVDGLSGAHRVIGVHYFNPAHIMPLVELHFGKATTNEVIEFTRALLHRTGKKTILVRKSFPGFVVNRIQAALGREIMYLLSQGAVTPEDIDIAARASYGFRTACIGNIEQFDMIGLDTLLAVGKGLFKTLDNSTDQPQYLYDMVARGELGVKSGKGL